MAARHPPAKYQIPEGFETLLEGLAKEVLRSQPENIYSFAADYFDTLLSARESTKNNQLATLVSSYDGKVKDQKSGNNGTSVQSTSLSSYESEATYHSEDESDETERFASSFDDDKRQTVKVQKKSKMAAADDMAESGEDEAAVKIQANYRGYKTRKCIKTKDRQSKAATKIQAGYRGHKVRTDIMFNNRKEESAAVKIQANYRGYRDRKHHNITRAPGKRRGIRSTKYSVGSISVSSDGSLVEYGELESVDFGIKSSDPLLTKRANDSKKTSSESGHSGDQQSISGRSGSESALTSE
ncbi:uncharacterized protein LOC144439983 [Glandiceps talaboti]